MSTEPIYATSLETAKEGEIVCLHDYSERRPEVITKTTSTKIVLGRKEFNRRGSERGKSWSRIFISATTPEKMKEILNNQRERKEHAEASYNLKSTNWDRLTLDQLRQVHTLVQSFKA